LLSAALCLRINKEKTGQFFLIQKKNLKLQKDGILSGGRAPPAKKIL
jgi:hypothetical protein